MSLARARPWGRRGLLAAIALAGVVDVLAGLARLGFVARAGVWSADHGPTLVVGVFASVISLERAVALGSWFWFGAPIVGTLGALAM